ncbi:MAG: hypothetical protein QHJ73_17445, partial [Armatimonadota bacterium]|nr:hypothetical protein [Armatimonadota bacterium]
ISHQARDEGSTYYERIVDYAIFPPQGPVRWPALVVPYVKNSQVFVCPSDPAFGPGGTPLGNSERLGYGMGCHIVGMPLAQLNRPSQTVLAAETRVYLVKAAACDPRTGQADPAYRGQTWGSEPETTRPVLYRHLEMAVFAFADGHVKVMAKTQAEQTADTEEGMPLSGVEARSPTNVFLLWNNAGR